ncbi:MAG: hypothetical protein K6G42_01800 [Lachnospiraceae bacterium]|nr:hypothetical protein [Lachnospiraceae bacterium]
MHELCETEIDTAAKKRKHLRHISLSGTGIILYALWDILKMVTSMMTGGVEEVDLDLLDENEAMIAILYSFLFWIILAVLTVIHLIIGYKAIKFGKGLSHKSGFLIPATILGIITLGGMPLYFLHHTGNEFIDYSVAAFIMDLIMLVIVFDMTVSTIRVLKIDKMSKEQG